MTVSDLAFLPAHAQAAAFRAGTFTPTDVVEAQLDRIQRLDQKLHAFTEVYADDARGAAAAATDAIRRGWARGPLHGVTIALKDLIEIEGRETKGGTAANAGRISAYTATIVEKALAAGMIVIGKTHTVEFAMGGWGTNSLLGTPWNPWDAGTHRAPGGSSSGSGVAVAAGLTTTAIGTDTGGSVRLPAAWCGHVGLKTSLGRFSVHGVLPLAESLDSPGPMTRSVEDASFVYAALSGVDPNDLSTYRPVYEEPAPTLKLGLNGMRIGRMPEQDRSGVDPEILEAYDAALHCMAKAGATIIDIVLPVQIADMAGALGQIIHAEGYAHYSHFVDTPNAPLDEHVRPRLASGKQTSSRDYILAKREQQKVIAGFHQALAPIDALLTPTVAEPAPVVAEIDQTQTPALFTRAVNMAEMCACAIPIGFSSGGLPLSAQFVSAYNAETTALRAAWGYEQARGFEMGIPEGFQ
jgi:aspartyl-tRNA(Asn)/glutamyl-tRNA(Gln) amidotransferase subunit A